MTLTLESNSFSEGERIPNNHHMSEAFGLGCSGGNISPELHWEGVPEGTKSLALIMDDPDAMGAVGKVWVHWVIWNMLNYDGPLST